jgi:hypothetical protein
MTRSIPLLTLALLAASGLNAQERFYQWTDAQGVVHYSQTPPENMAAKTRDINTRDPVPPPMASAQVRTPEEISCERARVNLDLLNENTPLTVDKDGDGKVEPMSAEGRAAAKDLAKKQISAFCSPS